MSEAEKINPKKKEIFSFSRAGIAITEHALEQVGVIKDVIYVNDFKSTSIKQTCTSINLINAEIILMTGGRDSNTDYSFLHDTDVSKIKAIIYTGDNCERVFRQFSKLYMLLVNATDMREAVKSAKSFAKKDQVVLFSPACPSFDVFDNYKNRGNKFRSLIQELQHECTH